MSMSHVPMCTFVPSCCTSANDSAQQKLKGGSDGYDVSTCTWLTFDLPYVPRSPLTDSRARPIF